MPAKKINVAVAGLGFMGVTHLRVHQQLRHARVVAVCDAQRLPVHGVLRGVNGNITSSADINLGPQVKVYREFAELLADSDVELVDICTPTSFHPAQAIAALKAGKHVLCEKPVAQNAADARKVLQAATTSRKFFMPAMCMRFWPGWAGLKKIVAEKTYGRVLAADFRRLSAKPTWAAAGSHFGGALFDLHIHDTDFVNFLFGTPESVFSTGVRDANGSVDHVVTQYFFPDGPVVHAEGSWLLPQGFHMSFTLHCERAALDFDLARGKDALQLIRPGKKAVTVKLAAGDGYAAEIRYFVDCVARGRAPAVVNAQDAVTALAICEAEEKSVLGGKLISLR